MFKILNDLVIDYELNYDFTVTNNDLLFIKLKKLLDFYLLLIKVVLVKVFNL